MDVSTKVIQSLLAISDDGNETLCPVPPGCTADTDCAKKIANHMASSAPSYEFIIKDDQKEAVPKFSMDIISKFE